MPRGKNQTLESAFHSWKSDDRKGWTVRCHHCGWTRARHAGRQRQHLSECSDGHHHVPVSEDQEAVHRLHLSAARAVFMSGLPFSIMENPYEIAYQKELTRLKAYMPPDAEMMERKLLPELHRVDRDEVLRIVCACGLVNLVLDNAGGDGVEVWAITDRDAFYWGNIEAGLGIPEQLERLLGSVHALTAGDWNRWNSLLVDIRDPVMVELQKLIEQDSRTKHVFVVPCHLMMLEHLFSDILSQPGEYADTASKITKLANSLHSAVSTNPSEASVFRHCQKQNYGEPKAFIFPLLYHGSRRDNLVHTISHNQSALKSYTAHPSCTLPSRATDIIDSSDFWVSLTSLTSALQSITDLQQTLEQDNRDLSQLPEDLAHLHEKWTFFPPPHALTNIAQALHPAHRSSPPTSSPTDDIMIAFLKRYSTAPSTAREQYAWFRLGTAAFSAGSTFELQDEPRKFWAEMAMVCPELGRVAARVFAVPTCGRGGMRRWVQRGWNGSGKMEEMLRFVYINRRVLSPREERMEWELGEWKKIKMEDDALGIVGGGGL